MLVEELVECPVRSGQLRRLIQNTNGKHTVNIRMNRHRNDITTQIVHGYLCEGSQRGRGQQRAQRVQVQLTQRSRGGGIPPGAQCSVHRAPGLVGRERAADTDSCKIYTSETMTTVAVLGTQGSGTYTRI